jgi:hypothetical protein
VTRRLNPSCLSPCLLEVHVSFLTVSCHPMFLSARVLCPFCGFCVASVLCPACVPLCPVYVLRPACCTVLCLCLWPGFVLPACVSFLPMSNACQQVLLACPNWLWVLSPQSYSSSVYRVSFLLESSAYFVLTGFARPVRVSSGPCWQLAKFDYKFRAQQLHP